MLDRFGFTPTESRVYQALLRIGPSTGYGVARELGIARANVYQALDELVRRRAARKAATSPTQYAAVLPTALLSELERDFRHDLEVLGEALRRMPQTPATADGDPLVLEHRAQLLKAAITAVDEATSEVLAVMGPWASGLAGALDRAHERGIATRCVSLGRPAPAAAAIRPVPESELLSYWGGLPIAVVGDRARTVFGLLTGDDSASGLMTASPGVVPFVRHLLRRELASTG